MRQKEVSMVWWIAAIMGYVVILAVLCLFFKGAAVLNERFEAADMDLLEGPSKGYV